MLIPIYCAFFSFQESIVNPTNCGSSGSSRLSALNTEEYPRLNDLLEGDQVLANAVGKIEAYITLIQTTLDAEYNDGMQTLYDVLKGVAQDLYLLVSWCKTTVLYSV